MRWNVKENVQTLCPGLTIENLPTNLPANLRIIHSTNGLSIIPENIVGMIPCVNGSIIDIAPKYRDLDPIEMSLFCYNISYLDYGKKIKKIGIGHGSQITDSLMYVFAAELQEVTKYPKKFERKAQHYVGNVAKGKVNWAKTSLNSYHSISDNVVDGIEHVATRNIPENIVIGQAATIALHYIKEETQIRYCLKKWALEFGRKKLTERDTVYLRKLLVASGFGGAHAYYYKVLALACIIVGISDVSAGDLIDEKCMVFNTPALYEEFIRNSIMRSTLPYGLTCQKGFVPKSFLFGNGICELIPDITLYQGNEIKAVLDVKYKIPDSKDYYQVFTYMSYAGLNTAYIISPGVMQGDMMYAYNGLTIQQICIDTSEPHIVKERIQSVLGSVI